MLTHYTLHLQHSLSVSSKQDVHPCLIHLIKIITNKNNLEKQFFLNFE